MNGSSQRPRVVVTDGEQRSALAACRGLARGGFAVTVTAARRPAPAQWSRFCDLRVGQPDPRHDPEAFALRIADIAPDGACVVPGSEASLLALSQHRNLFRTTRLGLPAHEVVVRATDKVALLEAAADVGVEPPPSVICGDASEAAAAAASLGLPVIMKPRRSFAEQDGHLIQRTPLVAAETSEVAEHAATLGSPFIVQRYLPDARLLAVAGVFGGRLLALAAAEYQRTWPPRAGSSCSSRTIAPPAGLIAAIERLLTRIEWQGIFQIQILHSVDGTFAALDLNPRIYGSLALAIGAGANLPAIWCRWLLDASERERVDARPGVRYRWEEGEAKHLVWLLRRHDVGKVVSLLRPHRRVVHAEFQTADPAPLVARVLSIARRIRRRGQR